MALLSPILPHKAIVAPTPAPVTIEAPKGVVTGEGKAGLSKRLGQTTVTVTTVALPPATTTSFINPNLHYMDVENTPAAEPTPEPVILTQPGSVPVEAPENNGMVNGLEFSSPKYPN